MALYHFHVEQIKRSEGRTAVASAAYRAGEKLHNLWDGETHDYTRKGGVIAALKEWIAETKKILREPQEVYLAQLLSEAHTMRNETAMTYTRGKSKAKKNNLKRFMDECNYLKQRGVLTLSDFERYLSSVGEKVEASKSSMNQK